MTELDPAVYHRRLLFAFRTLRDDAGLTQQEVADRLGWSPTKLLRIENGKNNISRDDLAALLAVYGVTRGQALQDLVELAGRANEPSFPQFAHVVTAEFRVYAGLETAASSIQEYEPVLIPGMLQSVGYAEAVITALSPEGDDADVIARRLDIRRKRQRLLTGAGAPTMHFLIDEAAVRRQVGGRSVMLGQLERLKELNALPTVTIQLVPFSVGEHVAMNGPFIILEFPDGDDPLLYLEDPRHDLLTRDNLPLTRTYQQRFAAIAALATPAARFDRIVDDLIASLDVRPARPPGARDRLISSPAPPLTLRIRGATCWRGGSVSGTGDHSSWHKSSRSGATGACVEIRVVAGNVVLMRDSKDPDGPRLSFGSAGLDGLRRGYRRRRVRPSTVDTQAGCRSASLRRTQNSLPSGSASTTQPVPSGWRMSLTRVAPTSSSRDTSSSRRVSGSRQTCTRFFTTLGSGTPQK